ncbi:fungal-specific transcription factor domain-containing protein [Aspergillus cavernicola]|uniref:Fungal-specific transcription factor domain-containing protein n=1 Tax=Aspergillus cavernicola TaxID=176166 RepID=A0ABR4HAQ4_9EURO
MQACDRCNRRKSRCSGERPSCRQCQKSKVACNYTDRARNTALLAERVAMLEKRLKDSEAEKETLAAQLGGSQTHTSSVAIDGPSRADIANEVSFLAFNAAGDRHYLGSASGVLFAHLVLPETDESTVEAYGPQIPEAFSRDKVANTHSDGGPRSVTETLPSELLTWKLFWAYLGHDHVRYPFLDPAFVHSVLEKIYTDRAFDSMSAFEWFTFEMVLSIAKLQEYKSDWQQTPPAATTHYFKATFYIKEVLRSGGLQSLQAILLLIQYRMSSPVQDTSASLWHLVGIAARMVYGLGLHREASYTMSTAPQTQEMRQLQCIRRLCFWCVFALDRVVSITLGRPLALNADDFDVDLPSLSGTTTDAAVDVAPDGESHENRDATQAQSPLRIFVHIVHHMDICGNIMRFLHGVKPIQSDVTGLTRRNHLIADLDKWRQSTADLEYLWQDSPQETSCFRCREWYELLYHNAILLAYRPSLARSDAWQDSSTLQRIFDSSRQAIRLYAYLYESRRLNYSWITLHSVFMAGLSYIYAVARHVRERREPGKFGKLLSDDLTVVQIVADTRACSNVLVAVSERWNITKRCHKVFDKLSDAVLTEAVKPSAAVNVDMDDSTTLHDGRDDLEFQNYFGDLFNSSTYPFMNDLDLQSLHGWPIASGWC